MLSIVVKNKIRHVNFLSGIRHQPEKTGIFLIGNPSSHCPVFSELNNTSLYVASFPSPPQAFTPVGLTPASGSAKITLLVFPSALTHYIHNQLATHWRAIYPTISVAHLPYSWIITYLACYITSLLPVYFAIQVWYTSYLVSQGTRICLLNLLVHIQLATRTVCYILLLTY